MPKINVRKEFRKHIVPDESGDDSDLERLLRNSEDDLCAAVDRKHSKFSSRHIGSADALPFTSLHGAGDSKASKKQVRHKQRDEAIQVTLLDHEKTMKQQKIKIKKLSQENIKLESQVRSYEQRLREMRQDAVYRDLTAGEADDEGMCAPVREAWRSFHNLFRTAWFRFWLKLQIQLEDKQRNLSKDDLTKLEPNHKDMPTAANATGRTSKEAIQLKS
jgi:hypothetical protein